MNVFGRKQRRGYEFQIAPQEVGTYPNDIDGTASLLENYSYAAATPWEKWSQINAGRRISEVYYESWAAWQSLDACAGPRVPAIKLARCWVSKHVENQMWAQIDWYEVDNEYIVRNGDFVRFELGEGWALAHHRLIPLPLTDEQETQLLHDLVEERRKLDSMGGS